MQLTAFFICQILAIVMSSDSLDPQLQTLYNLLMSEIGSLRSDVKSDITAMNNNINVMNNSINRLHERLDSHINFHEDFMEVARNRLNSLERRTA
jgi:Mg2+ and Co2+ transporter CorA